MSDETYRKQELLALLKDSERGNNRCADCDNPNPQWASLSFGAWICLECSGVHRSFGVHRTFVRSATMDKWSEEQMAKMKLGGNKALNDFLSSYGSGGGYEKGMTIQEKYDTWAALQYKDKLSALCSTPPQSWSPSPAPPRNVNSQPSSGSNSRPSSAQGVRKARGLGGNGSSGLSQEVDEVDSRRAANENFFSGLGDRNASRSADLPPSQGGKYQGFGSTPDPPPSNSHPSFALSSHNAPSLDELRNDPMKAASKGWGLFSAAVSMASRTVQTTLSDPALADNIRYGIGSVANSASSVAASTNSLIKERAGVDLAGKFSELGTAVGGSGGGYGGYRTAPISQEGVHHGGERIPNYRDDDSDGEGDDFHAVFGNNPSLNKSSSSAPAASSTASAKKSSKWDDEFEDF